MHRAVRPETVSAEAVNTMPVSRVIIGLVRRSDPEMTVLPAQRQREIDLTRRPVEKHEIRPCIPKVWHQCVGPKLSAQQVTQPPNAGLDKIGGLKLDHFPGIGVPGSDSGEIAPAQKTHGSDRPQDTAGQSDIKNGAVVDQPGRPALDNAACHTDGRCGSDQGIQRIIRIIDGIIDSHFARPRIGCHRKIGRVRGFITADQRQIEKQRQDRSA